MNFKYKIMLVYPDKESVEDACYRYESLDAAKEGLLILKQYHEKNYIDGWAIKTFLSINKRSFIMKCRSIDERNLRVNLIYRIIRLKQGER